MKYSFEWHGFDHGLSYFEDSKLSFFDLLLFAPRLSDIINWELNAKSLVLAGVFDDVWIFTNRHPGYYSHLTYFRKNTKYYFKLMHVLGKWSHVRLSSFSLDVRLSNIGITATFTLGFDDRSAHTISLAAQSLDKLMEADSLSLFGFDATLFRIVGISGNKAFNRYYELRETAFSKIKSLVRKHGLQEELERQIEEAANDLRIRKLEELL